MPPFYFSHLTRGIGRSSVPKARLFFRGETSISLGSRFEAAFPSFLENIPRKYSNVFNKLLIERRLIEARSIYHGVLSRGACFLGGGGREIYRPGERFSIVPSFCRSRVHARLVNWVVSRFDDDRMTDARRISATGRGYSSVGNN